jgi:hypothetical protein
VAFLLFPPREGGEENDGTAGLFVGYWRAAIDSIVMLDHADAL